MGNPFSHNTMMNDFSNDEIQILEIVHPKLLIENNKSIKIYLEGFMPVELLKLRDIVKKNGGEISRNPGIDIITLSPSNYHPETVRDRFQVKWLHESISSNVIQDLQKYELTSDVLIEIKANPDAQNENVFVKKEQKHQIQKIAASPTKVAISKKSATTPERKSEIRTINRESDSDSCSDDEKPILKRQELKSRKRSAAKCICTYYDSPKMKKPLYSRREEKAMINFLIEKDAIEIAGGLSIWRQMVKEKKIKRKASALRGHFNNALRYRVKLYTDDEEVLAEFKKREDDLLQKRLQCLD